MPYVMVPVPEEHVEEVMQFVVRSRARASIEPWDAESIEQLFTEVDEASRSVLSYVARATLGERDLTEVELARLTQLSPRETIGIQRELNDRARDGNRASLIGRRTVLQQLPNGRSTEVRLVTMDEQVAALIRDAERKELQDVADPLADKTS